jgi:hypothetical protein
MENEPQSEQDIMLSVWREAGRSQEGITIPCESEANARRLRFTMYNALKPVKAGKMQADKALVYAMANCSLSFTDDKKGLNIHPKVSTTLNKALLASLGTKPVQKLDDLLMTEMSERLQTIEPEPSKAIDTLMGAAASQASKYGARGV